MFNTFSDSNVSFLRRSPRTLVFVLSVIAGFVSFGTRNVMADDQTDAKDATSEAQADQGPKLNWQEGPSVGKLGIQAETKVPEGFVFLGAQDTVTLMQLYENPTNGRELGTIGPKEFNWFAVFEFNNSGYIKDDEKGTLDADAILASLKEGNKAGNAERKKRGWSTIEVEGWIEKPNYDPVTHNLQWCTRAVSEGKSIANYNTRILGRSGVMEVTLVASPDKLDEVVPEYKKLLSGFHYDAGNTYAEFRPGDKIAQYGLTALVTGGGLAIAAKTGLLAKLGLILAKAWKAIVVGVLALGAAIKSLFTRKKTAA